MRKLYMMPSSNNNDYKAIINVDENISIGCTLTITELQQLFYEIKDILEIPIQQITNE